MDRSGELQSQLYLLRIWIAPDPEGGAAWRGKLQPVPGEGSYCFAGSPELLALLRTLLAAPGAPPDGAGDGGASPGPATPAPSFIQES